LVVALIISFLIRGEIKKLREEAVRQQEVVIVEEAFEVAYVEFTD
jgi:hypothetical protein